MSLPCARSARAVLFLAATLAVTPVARAGEPLRVRFDPQNAPRLAAVAAAIEDDRLVEAIAAARALADGPRPPAAARLLLGTALARAFRFAEAERELRRAVADQPAMAATWHELGELLASTGRPKEALAALDRAAVLAPSPRLDYDRAMCALDAGDPAAAAGLLRRVLARAPGHPRALSQLGRLVVASGDPAGARDLLVRALVADPSDTDARFALAALDREEGRLDEAAAGYEAVLGVVPGHAGAIYGLARVRSARGDPAGAKDLFARYREALARQERIERLLQESRLAATDPAIRRKLAAEFEAAGRLPEAAAERRAAAILESTPAAEER